MLESQLRQDAPGRQVSRAAQGRVYNLDIVRYLLDDLRVDDLLLQLRHVGVVDFFADDLIQALFHGLGLIHGLHGVVVLDGLDFLDDLFIEGRGDLGAVLPVYLVAVVLRRVVAGRHHDARRAAQGAQRKGKLRGGTEGIEHIGLDAVGRQAQRRHVRELRRHAPGIVGDGNALPLGALLQDEIGQPLGGLADRVDVHAVGSGPDHAP